MVVLNDLARRHLSIGAAGRAHLRRLVGSWAPLADLSFSDLLLWGSAIRPAEADGATSTPDGEHEFVVLGQIRPTTAQTLHRDDKVGRRYRRSDRPLVAQTFLTGEPQGGAVTLDETMVHCQAVPVRHGGELVAVVTREARVNDGEAPSELERAYLGVFDRLSTMLVDGTFPFPFEDAVTEESPRVGDGALILDAEGRVSYSSPNAVSALHRLGYHGRINDSYLSDLGFDPDLVAGAYRLRVPVIDELERGEDATILCRIVPLVDQEAVTGALVLLRDVSDVRRRDRMLVSMDTTIREIHHRVKNNLQTVSSLLRIQGRRLESPEAKAAIEESVRRIASIAVVHEMLAKGGGDEVNFRDVLQPILAMAASTLVSPERPVEFRLVGDGPNLTASRASSLAVVVTELLQNAVEHGYPAGSAGGIVTVEMVASTAELRVQVHDDGVGLGEDFSLDGATGLGLTIISSLVSGELGGDLHLRPARPPQRGTIARVTVQIDEGEASL